MSRFGPRRGSDGVPPGGSWPRLGPIVALVALAILLTGCGPEVAQPYSHIYPQTEKAEDIQFLYKIIFWASLIVFIGVQVALGYTALRFRRRNTSLVAVENRNVDTDFQSSFKSLALARD